MSHKKIWPARVGERCLSMVIHGVQRLRGDSLLLPVFGCLVCCTGGSEYSVVHRKSNLQPVQQVTIIPLVHWNVEFNSPTTSKENYERSTRFRLLTAVISDEEQSLVTGVVFYLPFVWFSPWDPVLLFWQEALKHESSDPFFSRLTVTRVTSEDIHGSWSLKWRAAAICHWLSAGEAVTCELLPWSHTWSLRAHASAPLPFKRRVKN